MSDTRTTNWLKRVWQRVGNLENLVKHLFNIQVNGVSYPTVDFIVDKFDRTGAQALGQYWINPGAFSVVEGQGAVGMAGAWQLFPGSVSDASFITRYQKIVDDINSNTFLGSATPSTQSGGQLARYKARMSSDDFTVQVKFRIPTAINAGTDGPTGKVLYLSATNAFGIGASFDSSELGGIVGTIWGEHHVLSTENYVSNMIALRSFVTSDDGSNIALSGFSDLAYDYKYADYDQSAGLMVVGENVAQMVFSGNTISLIINGSTVFSDTTGTYAKGRAIGMMCFAACGLVAGAYNITELPAITEFKAWVSGQSEPSSAETGHGTYDDGELVYTDGYHNEAGEYDPLALES